MVHTGGITDVVDPCDPGLVVEVADGAVLHGQLEVGHFHIFDHLSVRLPILAVLMHLLQMLNVLLISLLVILSKNILCLLQEEKKESLETLKNRRRMNLCVHDNDSFCIRRGFRGTDGCNGRGTTRKSNIALT